MILNGLIEAQFYIEIVLSEKQIWKINDSKDILYILPHPQEDIPV